MKKLFILICMLFFCLNVFASDYKALPYKGIKNESKIKISDSGTWSAKVNRKDADYFIKRDAVLYNQDDSVNFITNCNFMFIDNGRLIGYSDSDLKFYEFMNTSGNIEKNELSLSEIAKLFKDFRIVLISDFSKATNVYKFKKMRSEEKIMVINDTSNVFDNYGFTTNNSKFENYNINNAINVTKHGMIQFSKVGDDTKYSPWFILLIR